jgi:hypothetical protein
MSRFFFFKYTSVDTEMCCPKSKCGCQYFILLTLKKKKSWTQGSWIFFNKKLILDFYFCLKSGPVFLFQILYEYQQFFQHRICFSIQPQLQLVNLHRNRRYFVIKLHTWFCLSYFFKTNIKFYSIYQYLMSINSFFNTVSVSRYSRPITVTRDPD